ncbi:hypothetical protein [Paraliomyxa miuraensis]|uniref:hypothetical protein n=1 Tax=Paraliomyxa miuraensis TaxID=376150 RepID=UPI00224E168E|nr:hypothetical protein [Paraliomyxa miuraensis]MCX4243832.1 hypothetical protein [Paraliomyxa miuraensis]
MLPVALATLVALAGLGPVAPAVAASPSSPSPAALDEVRLPSGGFVRGQIQALMPGQYVEIRKLDGEIQRFEWSEIQSVVKADGTVVERDSAAAPVAQPEPTWEPGTESGTAGGVDPGFGEATPSDAGQSVDGTASTGAGASPGFVPTGTPGPDASVGPTIEIAVDRKGPPVSLYRLGDSTRALCEAPCNQAIRPGYLFVASSGKRIGKGFEITTDAPGYRVDVKRSSPLRKWSGVALIPVGLIVGIGIGIIPALHNVPKSKVAGYAVGGTLIGLAGIGGGVTLLMFSRSKVEVLPQTGLARR